MFQAQLPLTLWVEAFIIATYLINIMPLSTINMKSPFEKLFNKVLDYDKLRTFGCRCFPYLNDYNKNKFNKKSQPCVFVGYSLLHKGYHCLDLKTKRVYISKHVVFDESTFPFANLSSSCTLQESPKLVKNKWFSSSATNVEELNPITSSCDNILMLPICYAPHTSKNFDFAETSKTTTPSHETNEGIY